MYLKIIIKLYYNMYNLNSVGLGLGGKTPPLRNGEINVMIIYTPMIMDFCRGEVASPSGCFG